MADNHPTESELLAKAEFRLSLQATASVDEHLRACPDCNSRYREIAKDRPAPPAAPRVE